MAKRRTLRASLGRWLAVTVTLGLAYGCGARRPDIVGPPPIPARSGPLVIDVVYPREGALISARDSNFIFGSVGHGGARLTINGRPVPVEPNGAFLAWLPVPAAAEDSLARYDLEATVGDRRLRRSWTVRLPRPARPLPADSAALDAGSLRPRGAWWVRPGEQIPIEVRATPGALVELRLPDGEALQLAEFEEPSGGSSANWIFGEPLSTPGLASAGRYRGVLKANDPLGRGRLWPGLTPVPAGPSTLGSPCAGLTEGDETGSGVATPDSVPAAKPAALDASASRSVRSTHRSPDVGGRPGGDVEGRDSTCAIVRVIVDGDTAEAPLPLDLWVTPRDGPVVELREEPSAAGRDGFVVGRAAPGATTFWMWSEGARARVTGRRDGEVRIRLDSVTEAWVAADETRWLPGGERPDAARVSTVRLRATPTAVTARLSVDYPVPYRVELDRNRVTLILYGAYGDTDWLRYGPGDDYLEAARWDQVLGDRYLLHLDLAGPPWGYRVSYEPGALVLQVRKPPAIDGERPLAGRTIIIDPGHPPAGATGPTGLYEGDANLAIAYRLRRLLEQEGARALLTRADAGAVRLYDRTRRAEQVGGELLVSIHNNALPDGVNPIENHGTSVYYFHPHSLGLARALQRGLLQTLGLRDLGIGRASLALARPTWMPAALTEGAFMMIPAQEAGLRDPRYQEAYARGVLDGLREFLRGRAH